MTDLTGMKDGLDKRREDRTQLQVVGGVREAFPLSVQGNHSAIYPTGKLGVLIGADKTRTRFRSWSHDEQAAEPVSIRGSDR